jgi:hypothetical protein
LFKYNWLNMTELKKIGILLRHWLTVQYLPETPKNGGTKLSKNVLTQLISLSRRGIPTITRNGITNCL